MSRIDARLREMQFLAKLDREGEIHISGSYDGSPERQMLISLIEEEYVNGFDAYPVDYDEKTWSAGRAMHVHHGIQVESAAMLLTRHPKGGPSQTSFNVCLRMCHKGRVRLSELEQQLKTSRDRDETGLLWAKRHLRTDLAIAILSASAATPLSVAFLDMNGLGLINTDHGHAGGDAAILAFFQAATATLGQRGDVYRNGGDEMVVLLPGVDDTRACELLDGFVRQLSQDALRLGDANTEVRLTASCGSASTSDPNEDAGTVLDRADKVMYRAKSESGPPKAYEGRVSAFAAGDAPVKTYPPRNG